MAKVGALGAAWKQSGLLSTARSLGGWDPPPGLGSRRPPRKVAVPAGGLRLSAIVCEARPLCEGVQLANSLAGAGVGTTLITDAQVRRGWGLQGRWEGRAASCRRQEAAGGCPLQTTVPRCSSRPPHPFATHLWAPPW